MPVIVRIPGALRQHTDNARTVEVDLPPGGDVGRLLAMLEADNPALVRRICDETGALRQHVNLYLDSANVRDCEGLATVIPEGAEVYLLPAVSGG